MKKTTYRSRTVDKKEVPEAADGKMRLNKFVAHCGICSRREAAVFVKDGKIKVNSKIELNPAYDVQPKDKIFYLDKRIFPQENKVYVVLNKPKNYITTLKDEKTRHTVLELVENHINERIYPVGRLDRNSTGVLLMTNDGDLAQKLSHPKFKVKKIYHVGLDKNLHKNDIEKILKGVMLDDGKAEVDSLDYVDNKKDEIGIEIHSGKNRIIRRIFESLGYEVKKLDRVYYAGLTKKSVPRGKFRHLTSNEIITLKHFLK
ncbi:MAG: rRNA pseudouridine synthase [Saprospiraceae bacterium]|nr:rRNA pseudouridine synthase [Saprospiraceae bacterium]